jgi:hypothetical protein
MNLTKIQICIKISYYRVELTGFHEIGLIYGYLNIR